VEVVHALPRIGTHVGNQTPTASVDAVGLRQMGRHLEDLGQHLTVAVMKGSGRLHVLFRDDENVGGGPRIDVSEGHNVVGGVDHVCFDLLRGDPAKQAVLHGRNLSVQAAERRQRQRGPDDRRRLGPQDGGPDRCEKRPLLLGSPGVLLGDPAFRSHEEANEFRRFLR